MAEPALAQVGLDDGGIAHDVVRQPLRDPAAERPSPTAAIAARARTRARGGDVPCAKALTMTLSSTVSCGKVRTTWKVRPIPRRQIALGRRPWIGVPR